MLDYLILERKKEKKISRPRPGQPRFLESSLLGLKVPKILVTITLQDYVRSSYHTESYVMLIIEQDSLSTQTELPTGLYAHRQ